MQKIIEETVRYPNADSDSKTDTCNLFVSGANTIA